MLYMPMHALTHVIVLIDIMAACWRATSLYFRHYAAIDALLLLRVSSYATPSSTWLRHAADATPRLIATPLRAYLRAIAMALRLPILRTPCQLPLILRHMLMLLDAAAAT